MTRIAVAGLAGLLLLGWIGVARPLEITPSAWDTGDWIEAILTGSPLAAPDSISLRGSDGEVIAADAIEATGDTISFLLDLRHAVTGTYDLRLANLAGDVHTEPQCFEVRPLALPAAWLEPVRLTEELEASERPKVAADRSGQVHVVWQNGRASDSGEFDIQYRRMSGGVWTAPDTLSDTGG
jgi:hypothetical protein